MPVGVFTFKLPFFFSFFFVVANIVIVSPSLPTVFIHSYIVIYYAIIGQTAAQY